MAQDYILADLNVRDNTVSDSKETLLYDSKVIVQSVTRLLNTPVMTIPNFRNYGLDVKRFLQYPMSEDTVNEIYKYVKDRVAAFEDRATIVKADVDADLNNGYLYMIFYLRINETQETYALPQWSVKIGSI